MTEYDIVIVGAGPAGIAAACVAAESGRHVALLDDAPWRGGQIWRGQSQKSALANTWFARLRLSGAEVLEQATVFALPRPGALMAEQRGRTLELGWERLILATGARELFLPFPGWTLPGVMGAGGLQGLMKNGWPIQGQRVAVAGSGPLLLAVAEGVMAHGGHVVCIGEQASKTRVLGFGLGLWRHSMKMRQAVELTWRLRGVPRRFGVWPVRAEGDGRVQQVAVTDGKRTWDYACDVLACSFGLVPNIELAILAGCQFNEGLIEVDPFLATSVEGVYCAGELTGIAGAESALIQGQIAGYAAAGQRARAEQLLTEAVRWRRFGKSLGAAFALRPELRGLASDETILCRCEDVSVERVRQSNGWRDAKLQTRCGMGPCQGRICGAAAQFLWGWRNDSVRPPAFPVQVKSLISTNSSESAPH